MNENNPPINRRQFIGTIAFGVGSMLAGCLGPSPVKAGEVSSPGDVIFNLEVNRGETIRVEVETIEGRMTFVTLANPNKEVVMEGEVETEETLSHTAKMAGVYLIQILPTGTASYQIFIETTDSDITTDNNTTTDSNTSRQSQTDSDEETTSTISPGEPPQIDELQLDVKNYTEYSSVIDENGNIISNGNVWTPSTKIERGVGRSGKNRSEFSSRIRFEFSNAFHKDVEDRTDYMMNVEFSAQLKDEQGNVIGKRTKNDGVKKGTFEKSDRSKSDYMRNWMYLPRNIDRVGSYNLSLSVTDLLTDQISEPESIEFELVDVIPESDEDLWENYILGYRGFFLANMDYSQARSRYSNSDFEAVVQEFKDASHQFDDARTKIGLEFADRNNENLTEEMREIGKQNMEVLEQYRKAAINFARAASGEHSGETEKAQEFEQKAETHHEKAQQMDGPIKPDVFKKRVWG